MDTNPYNRVANTWIADATEELNAALDALTRPQVWPPRFVVYHLQQATEKALKAALIFGRTGRFEATHNLDLLVKALPNDAPEIPQPERPLRARHGDPLPGG